MWLLSRLPPTWWKVLDKQWSKAHQEQSPVRRKYSAVMETHCLNALRSIPHKCLCLFERWRHDRRSKWISMLHLSLEKVSLPCTRSLQLRFVQSRLLNRILDCKAELVVGHRNPSECKYPLDWHQQRAHESGPVSEDKHQQPLLKMHLFRIPLVVEYQE